jgi:hypothetical protein
MTALIAWFTAHEMVLGGLIVGILDFLFSISPTAASNGILEWLLKQAEALVGSAGAVLKAIPRPKAKS